MHMHAPPKPRNTNLHMLLLLVTRWCARACVLSCPRKYQWPGPVGPYNAGKLTVRNEVRRVRLYYSMPTTAHVRTSRTSTLKQHLLPVTCAFPSRPVTLQCVARSAPSTHAHTTCPCCVLCNVEVTERPSPLRIRTPRLPMTACHTPTCCI